MNWNTTSDPCSGQAIDNTDFGTAKVIIKCVLSANTWHITQLKIFAQNVAGQISKEFQNLTYLFELDLRHNYLTGPLPSFLEKLTKMEYMNFAFNALSGTVPKEIGNLENLKLLSFSSNNLSGSLPSELGNLINLEQLHILSAGLSGEIPSTFSKLQKMKILWISDNNFTGKIPDFIGSFTDLTDLRLQGTSLQGPIPPSFANLTKLDKLMIGDITGGSSSMNFTNDMKSLTMLVLRNAKISGSIPSSIGSFARLGHLDLSFNNLSGLLPSFLFNMSNLKVLFLGNNSFYGGLPLEKRGSSQTIDISYNNLEGDFPLWVHEQGLLLNLVANNFAINAFSNSGLKRGSECLQKNMPCYHGSPIWSEFAINCGGSVGIRASDQLVYEQDEENLSGASYYVSPQRRWAVSSVGILGDNTSSSLSATLQFIGTLDPQLFQSSRLSASSLRYYGIGLENGNYSVKLQFADIAFPDPPDWKSIARRVFDIYIQGNLMERDFDIRKQTGGIRNAVLIKEFTTNVTENFLEIHLFWAGKGTCCIPINSYHGPIISAISVKPNFVPSVHNELPGSKSFKKSRTIIIVVVSVGVLTLLCLLACGVFMWRKKMEVIDDEELKGLDVKSEIFSYTELRDATEDFNPANKLGEGGFGAVYKGTLRDGRTMAVKKLSATSNHGKQQFVAEIGILTTVLHRNLVKLYGCCFEGNKRLLVYEYLENKSLDQALSGRSKFQLDWGARFNICLGTARGLAYLHGESNSRIVHRDVKASNILLDADLNPKISDFGLAKLFDEKKSHISTRIAGTIGYLAPEYAMRGHLTEKADTYSFGVVALEIVSGRPNRDSSFKGETMYLLEWVWYLHENNLHLELVDPELTSYVKEEVLRIIKVALACIQSSPLLRPSMSTVVSMIQGDAPIGDITTKPSYLTDWHFKDQTSGSYLKNGDSSASESQSMINFAETLSPRMLTDPPSAS